MAGDDRMVAGRSAPHELDVFIQGNLVNLVALSEEVARNSNWFSWFNDEATTRGMQQHHFPNSRAKQADFFRSVVQSNPNKLQLGVQSKESRDLIGVVSLSEIDWISRRASIAAVLGDRRHRSLDYWLESNELLIKHGFHALNLHRVSGGSIRKEVADLYVRLLRFTHEGVLRDHAFKDGSFRDSFIFSRLSTD